MSTLSAQQIEKYLSEYSLGIDYWDNQAGDTFLVLGSRELLQNSIADLNQDQSSRLKAIDSKAESVLLGYTGEETFDVQMLKSIVEIINHGSLRKVA